MVVGSEAWALSTVKERGKVTVPRADSAGVEEKGDLSREAGSSYPPLQGRVNTLVHNGKRKALRECILGQK